MKVAIVLPAALRSIPKGTFFTFIYSLMYLLNRMDDLPFKVDKVELFAPDQFPTDATRNVAAASAIEKGFDTTLWLDMDQTFPNNALFRLLNNSYPIISGMYYLKALHTFPIVFKRVADDTDFTWFKPILEYPRDDYFYADMIGMGCVKIDTKVFKAIADTYAKDELIEFFKYGINPIRYKGTDGEQVGVDTRDPERIFAEKLRSKYLIRDVSEDVYFWKQVAEKTDFKIVVDPKIQCGHVGDFEYTQGFNDALYSSKMEQLKKTDPKNYERVLGMICRAEKISSAS